MLRRLEQDLEEIALGDRCLRTRSDHAHHQPARKAMAQMPPRPDQNRRPGMSKAKGAFHHGGRFFRIVSL